MLGLSVAVADELALPSAFVVWRGFDESLHKAKEYGFDGVELALRRADDITPGKLDVLLRKNELAVSAISTGQVFADGGLSLTNDDASIRAKTLDILLELVRMSGEYGKVLNLGRVRGSIVSDFSEGYFIENANILCSEAEKYGVIIILEPVNRYEINFINNLDEGVELIKKTGSRNLKLMPDVFHMNIEDDSITGSLVRNQEFVHYIHLADSNRLAPGWGHLDFYGIFKTLVDINFKGWVSIEILPKPTPNEAAKQAADYIIPYLSREGRSFT